MPNAGNVDLCCSGKKRLEKWRAGVLSVNQPCRLYLDIPSVCPTDCPPDDDLVPFSNDVLDSRTEIRKRGVPFRGSSFLGFRVTESYLSARGMEDEIRSKNLIDNCDIDRAPDLVPVTTSKHFVVFCGHDVSPSSPSSARLHRPYRRGNQSLCAPSPKA